MKLVCLAFLAVACSAAKLFPNQRAPYQAAFEADDYLTAPNEDLYATESKKSKQYLPPLETNQRDVIPPAPQYQAQYISPIEQQQQYQYSPQAEASQNYQDIQETQYLLPLEPNIINHQYLFPFESMKERPRTPNVEIIPQRIVQTTYNEEPAVKYNVPSQIQINNNQMNSFNSTPSQQHNTYDQIPYDYYPSTPNNQINKYAPQTYNEPVQYYTHTPIQEDPKTVQYSTNNYIDNTPSSTPHIQPQTPTTTTPQTPQNQYQADRRYDGQQQNDYQYTSPPNTQPSFSYMQIYNQHPQEQNTVKPYYDQRDYYSPPDGNYYKNVIQAPTQNEPITNNNTTKWTNPEIYTTRPTPQHKFYEPTHAPAQQYAQPRSNYNSYPEQRAQSRSNNDQQQLQTQQQTQQVKQNQNMLYGDKLGNQPIQYAMSRSGVVNIQQVTEKPAETITIGHTHKYVPQTPSQFKPSPPVDLMPNQFTQQQQYQQQNFKKYAYPVNLPPSSTTEPMPILKQIAEMETDGSFAYETLTGDQTHILQQGHIENRGTDHEEQVMQGSYSFIGDDGRTYTVTYIADGNGFRATGDHLPTAPPIPEVIQRSIEQNLAEEAATARSVQPHPYAEAINNNIYNYQNPEQAKERGDSSYIYRENNNHVYHS